MSAWQPTRAHGSTRTPTLPSMAAPSPTATRFAVRPARGAAVTGRFGLNRASLESFANGRGGTIATRRCFLPFKVFTYATQHSDAIVNWICMPAYRVQKVARSKRNPKILFIELNAED